MTLFNSYKPTLISLSMQTSIGGTNDDGEPDPPKNKD